MLLCGLPLTKASILFTNIHQRSKNKKRGICCHLQVVATWAGRVPRKEILRKMGFH